MERTCSGERRKEQKGLQSRPNALGSAVPAIPRMTCRCDKSSLCPFVIGSDASTREESHPNCGLSGSTGFSLPPGRKTVTDRQTARTFWSGTASVTRVQGEGGAFETPTRRNDDSQRVDGSTSASKSTPGPLDQRTKKGPTCMGPEKSESARTDNGPAQRPEPEPPGPAPGPAGVTEEPAPAPLPAAPPAVSPSKPAAMSLWTEIATVFIRTYPSER